MAYSWGWSEHILTIRGLKAPHNDTWATTLPETHSSSHLVFSTRNAFPDSKTRTLDLLFMRYLEYLDLFESSSLVGKWPSQVAKKDQQKKLEFFREKTSTFSLGCISNQLLGWPFFHKSKHDEQIGSQQGEGVVRTKQFLLVLISQKKSLSTRLMLPPFLVTVTTKGWVEGLSFGIWTPKWRRMFFLSKSTLLLF